VFTDLLFFGFAFVAKVAAAEFFSLEARRLADAIGRDQEQFAHQLDEVLHRTYVQHQSPKNPKTHAQFCGCVVSREQSRIAIHRSTRQFVATTRERAARSDVEIRP
jgi:hypothetical protein